MVFNKNKTLYSSNNKSTLKATNTFIKNLKSPLTATESRNNSTDNFKV